MSETSYKYWAFISYSHQDQAWGDWLHRSLETYRVPRRLVGRASRDGAIPRRLFPIFRDRAELPSSADLGGVINEALRQSRYLIVICSPHAATSRWVDGEIRTFKSFGRADRVLHLIVHGEPNAGDHPESGLIECLPLASRFHVDRNGAITAQRAEPVAADARGGKDGRSNAKLKLIAGLLDVSFDELRQRERRRQRWRRLAEVAAALALLSLSFGGWRWQQNEKQRALAQQELKTHIAQVYESGRQELLAHNEARAAVYLNEAYRLGVDTPALRFMLGRAMRTVDAQVRRIDAGKSIFWINWSPDDRQLLTVDGSNRMRVWNVETGAKMIEIDPGRSDGWCSAFSPQGSLIWAQTWDRRANQVVLRIWNVQSGALIGRFEVLDTGECAKQPINSAQTRVTFVAPDKSIVVAGLDPLQNTSSLTGKFSAVAFCGSRDAVIAGDENGNAALIDAASSRTQFRLAEFGTRAAGAINAFSAIGNCEFIAAGAKDGAIRVWSGTDGRLMMSGGQNSAVRDLWLDRKGASLMSSAANGATIWNTLNGAVVYATRFQTAVNVVVGPNPSGENFAYLDAAHFRIVDPQTGNASYALDGHAGTVRAFAFSMDGEQLATAGADDGLVVWKLPQDLRARFALGGDPAKLSLPSLEPPPPAVIKFSHRGERFFIGGDDGSGELRDASSLKLLRRIDDHRAPLSAVAFSADDQRLATGGWDRTVRIRDLASGALLALPPFSGRVWQIAFDPSGRWLSTAMEGARTEIRDAQSGASTAEFEAEYSTAHAFSPLQPWFAIGTKGKVEMWDLLTNRSLWSRNLQLDEQTGAAITFVRFSGNGEQLLVTAERRRIFVLDARNGRVLRQTDAASSQDFVSADFSPDSRHIVLGDMNQAFLWQADDRRLSLIGHVGRVDANTFSADSTLLITAGDDGTAEVWDAESGTRLDTIAEQHGAIGENSAALGNGGDSLLLGGSDNSASLWQFSRETRSAQQVAGLLRCRVPWLLQGNALIQNPPTAAACAANL